MWLSLEEGSNYLVYAFFRNNSLSTNICTRTKRLTEAKEDLEELGKPIVTSVEEGLEGNNSQTPYLWQNYPNPFNPSTKISYLLQNSSYVRLNVYDILGKEIQTLVSEVQTAGAYSVAFDAEKLASGIYFYKLQIGDPSTGSGQRFVETKKMLFMR